MLPHPDANRDEQPLRHTQPPSPVHFPAEAEMPETKRHMKLRMLLYGVLETFAAHTTIGSDQFVYWIATDPKRALAPDAFVHLGRPDFFFDSWKTWEHGIPDLAVEIVSESDRNERAFGEKVAKYHEVGVGELVRFDPDAPAGARVRVWDRLEGDLVERVIENDRTPCTTLKLWWVVVPGADNPAALRLARDAEGRDLVLTKDEARTRKDEARIRELEAKLAERG